MAFMPSLTREARKALNEMYENDELTDITVKGEDSQIGHRIHAIVLASVSSKFKERVRPGSHDGEVRFPFPEQVLKAIIVLHIMEGLKMNFSPDGWKMPCMSPLNLKLRNCKMQ